MGKKILIGYGTGRCGTQSLAGFLDQQTGFSVTHERVALNWYPAFTDTEVAIRRFTSRPGKVVGDVGFYWVHYLDLILRRYPGAKAVNIRRDLDEVIESFWSYMRPDVQNFGASGWKGYPFDSYRQDKDAIAFTVRRYRFMEEEVVKQYPASIFLMKTEDLNDPEMLTGLLGWIGMEEYRILRPVHENKREKVLSTRNGRIPGRPLFKDVSERSSAR